MQTATQGPVNIFQQHVPNLTAPDDERLGHLALDSLFRAQALIASSLAGVPYAAARSAVDLSEEERIKLADAARQVINKHASFFSEHRDAIEVVVGLTALEAGWLDHLMLATTEDRPPTPWEVIGSLLILFSPLLLFLGLYGLAQLQRGDK